MRTRQEKSRDGRSRANSRGAKLRLQGSRADARRAVRASSKTPTTGEPQIADQEPGAEIEIVLGGGGVKGFAHAGALKALEQANVSVGTVTGVSIGSLIATLYTNGYNPDSIAEIFHKEMKNFNILKRTGKFVPRLLDAELFDKEAAKWLVDLKNFFKYVIGKYKLKPQPNLRVIAYNIITRKPVVFEGTNYDLATALAASCAVPFIMRPVWYGQQDAIARWRKIFRSWRRQSDEGVLVDGGLHHPAPGEFCKGRAIIFKLGMTTRPLPLAQLRWADFFLHLVEYVASVVVNKYYPDDESKHYVIHVGMDSVATMTFDLPDRLYVAMVEQGRWKARKALAKLVAAGRLPLRAAK